MRETSLNKASNAAHRTAALTPALEKAGVWRGVQPKAITAKRVGNVTSTGFSHLDKLLHVGGWPLGHMIECLTGTENDYLLHRTNNSTAINDNIGNMHLFLPAIKKLLQAHKKSTVTDSAAAPILLINPPYIPYSAAWEQQTGFSTSELPLWIISPTTDSEKVWACEQALHSNSTSAIFIWLDVESCYLKTSQLRKLQIAARRSKSLFIAMRHINARKQASPASCRVVVEPSVIHSQTQLGIHIIKQLYHWGGQQTSIRWHYRLQQPLMPAKDWPVHKPKNSSPLLDIDEQQAPSRHHLLLP